MFKSIKTAYNQIPILPQVVLVVTNMIPLLGVWFLGWHAGIVLAIYWGETAVIGFYAIFKMIRAEGTDPSMENADMDSDVRKIFLVILFNFHFGLFMLVHLVLILFLFFVSFDFSTPSLIAIGPIISPAVLLAMAGFFLSHGISYNTNYLAGGEYKTALPRRIMFQPYRRVMAMHIVIIMVGFLVFAYGEYQAISVTLLVIFKILLDLRAHTKEHISTQEQQQL